MSAADFAVAAFLLLPLEELPEPPLLLPHPATVRLATAAMLAMATQR
jgi:hypothetical protein